MRKDRDDKVHDSIIEERIQRERPCRTLFIRNIKASRIRELPDKNLPLICMQYETNSDDVRRQFEEFGSIKTFFDLISTRGMVFVTYVCFVAFAILLYVSSEMPLSMTFALQSVHETVSKDPRLVAVLYVASSLPHVPEGYLNIFYSDRRSLFPST
jgi:RNA recognition motif-containing protein